MAKNNMNAIANDAAARVIIDTTGDDRLFTKYINADAAAEEAAYKLRDAICTLVINNTAAKIRVDNEFYRQLIHEAEKFICKKSIKLYKDDKYSRTYTFIGNPQQILHEIQRFFKEVVVEYSCFYEDVISYEDAEGFCWIYDGIKIAIV
jgi:hypothetical protein